MTPTTSLPFLPPKEEEIFSGVLLMANPTSYHYTPREDGQMQFYLVVGVGEDLRLGEICVLEDDCKVYFWNVQMLIKETLLVTFPEDTEEQ